MRVHTGVHSIFHLHDQKMSFDHATLHESASMNLILHIAMFPGHKVGESPAH